ncbi:MAG TPA: hypothetical protein VF646_18305 [Cytophagales bacterium]
MAMLRKPLLRPTRPGRARRLLVLEYLLTGLLAAVALFLLYLAIG